MYAAFVNRWPSDIDRPMLSSINRSAYFLHRSGIRPRDPLGDAVHRITRPHDVLTRRHHRSRRRRSRCGRRRIGARRRPAHPSMRRIRPVGDRPRTDPARRCRVGRRRSRTRVHRPRTRRTRSGSRHRVSVPSRATARDGEASTGTTTRSPLAITRATGCDSTEPPDLRHRQTVVAQHVHDLGDHGAEQDDHRRPCDHERQPNHDVGDGVVGQSVGEGGHGCGRTPTGRAAARRAAEPHRRSGIWRRPSTPTAPRPTNATEEQDGSAERNHLRACVSLHAV